MDRVQRLVEFLSSEQSMTKIVDTKQLAERQLERIRARTLSGLDIDGEPFEVGKDGKPVTVASDDVFSRIEVRDNLDGGASIVAPGQTGDIVAFQNSLRPFFGVSDSDTDEIAREIRHMILGDRL